MTSTELCNGSGMCVCLCVCVHAHVCIDKLIPESTLGVVLNQSLAYILFRESLSLILELTDIAFLPE